MQKWRAEHPDKLREQRERARPKRAGYMRRFRVKHPNYMKEWRARNPEKVRAYDEKRRNNPIRRAYKRERTKLRSKRIQMWVKQLRYLVLNHYGAVCACCRETISEFLTVDHINGGGVQHRKKVGAGSNFYSWIVRNNFPQDLQILCMNCNHSKGVRGYCPHKSGDRNSNFAFVSRMRAENLLHYSNAPPSLGEASGSVEECQEQGAYSYNAY